MQNEVVTAIVSCVGVVFILDRLTNLIKALRSTPNIAANCAVDLEHISSLLQRTVDGQETIEAILREIAQGQSVLLDRRSNSERPRAIELLNALERERRRPLLTDPPPK